MIEMAHGIFWISCVFFKKVSINLEVEISYFVLDRIVILNQTFDQMEFFYCNKGLEIDSGNIDYFRKVYGNNK